jgi:MarR family transcriptional regulator, organic hydroperoxide resistance regulator
MKQDQTIELVEMMFKVSRLMKDKMSYTDNLMHLSILQIQTLIFLKKNDKTSMSDIADYFRIELPSATSLLNILYDRKLVKRLEDVNDRRKVFISLTSKGKILLEQAVRERRKKIEKMLSYLSKKEKSELLNIFKTLQNSLQK